MNQNEETKSPESLPEISTKLTATVNEDGSVNVTLCSKNQEELVILLVHLLSGSIYNASETIIQSQYSTSEYIQIVKTLKKSMNMLNKTSNQPVLNATNVFKRSYFA